MPNIEVTSIVETVNTTSWEGRFPAAIQARAVERLEEGVILFFPKLAFNLTQSEARFLSPSYLAWHSKNISLDPRSGRLSGVASSGPDNAALRELLLRYFNCANKLVAALLPNYTTQLSTGRTSLRPVEVAGRQTSTRKDDTLFHVDAFPANPMKGARILRLFTNVNAEGRDRVWRVGETFEDVARRFMSRLRQPIPGSAGILKALGITKERRTRYDHLMLHLHNAMKADDRYQKSLKYAELRFPPHSTWMVFTDQVSHAAVSGQHVFEQTFSLPVGAMANEDCSPLRILERLSKTPLI